MFDAFLSVDGIIALVTLAVLEVVLGIDNVIFIYFAMGFSVFVEMINLRLSKRHKAKPVKLHGPYTGP